MRHSHSISSGENAPAGPVNSNWMICDTLYGPIEVANVLSLQYCADMCAVHPNAVGFSYELAATEAFCYCWDATCFPSGVKRLPDGFGPIEVYAIGAPANPPLPTDLLEPYHQLNRRLACRQAVALARHGDDRVPVLLGGDAPTRSSAICVLYMFVVFLSLPARQPAPWRGE